MDSIFYFAAFIGLLFFISHVRRKELLERLDILEKDSKQMKKELERLVRMVEPEAASVPEQPEPDLVKPIKVQRVEAMAEIVVPAEPAQPAQSVQEPAEKPKAKLEGFFNKDLFSIESIITKLGILLLVIGAGYLSKLAYDAGYLTVEIVLLMVTVIGIGLIVSGDFVRKRGRYRLCIVLFGGGIAVLYTTVYAAFQVYGVINEILTFIFMVSITFFAFALSLRSSNITLSIFGILGGLLTPFLIEFHFLNLFGVGLYIILLSIGSQFFYVFKRWRLLQLSNIAGTYTIVFYLIASSMSGNAGNASLIAGLAVILMLIFCGTEYGLFLLNKERNEWPMVSEGIQAALPILTLLVLLNLLQMSQRQWSYVLFVWAMAYAALWLLLYKKRHITLVSDISLSYAALMLMFSAILFYGAKIQAAAVVTEALILYGINRKIKHKLILYIGHGIAAVGAGMAFFMVYEAFVFSRIGQGEIIGALAVIALLTGAAYFHKGNVRLVFGNYLYVFFGTLLLMFILVERVDTEVTIIVMTVWFLTLHLVVERTGLIKGNSPALIVLVPFFAVEQASWLQVIYGTSFEWLLFMAKVIFIVGAYGLTLLAKDRMVEQVRIAVKLLAYIALFALCSAEGSMLSHSMEAPLVLTAGILILQGRFEPSRTNEIMSGALVGFKVLWLAAAAFYIWIDAVFLMAYEMSFTAFFWNALILVGLYLIMASLNMKKPYIFIIHYIAFMIVTYGNIGVQESARSLMTLIWATYPIIGLVYGVVKSRKAVANISMVMILFVAVKFLVVDLATLNIVWKIITAMLFGLALLVLSYFLQPKLSE